MVKYEDIFSKADEDHLIETISMLYDCAVSVANNPDLKITRVENRPEICEYIMGHSDCAKYCKAMKETLANKLKDTGKVTISNCPFGFANMIIPLKLYGETLGALYLCGQYRSEQPTEKVENIVEKFGLDKEKYLNLLSKATCVKDSELVKAQKLILKNCDFFVQVIHNSYLLNQINQRETFLREMQKLLLNAESFDIAVSGIMKQLLNTFNINRVVVVDINDGDYVKSEYSNEQNFLMENFTKEQYKALFDALKAQMEEEKTNIITINTERIMNSKKNVSAVFDYWRKGGLSSITALYHDHGNRQRFIIFVLYNNDEKVWTEEELSFITIVSEQICMSLKMRDLQENYIKNLKDKNE